MRLLKMQFNTFVWLMLGALLMLFCIVAVNNYINDYKGRITRITLRQIRMRLQSLDVNSLASAAASPVSGIDAWGNPISFSVTEAPFFETFGDYIIEFISNGEDGILGTRDDITGSLQVSNRIKDRDEIIKSIKLNFNAIQSIDNIAK